MNDDIKHYFCLRTRERGRSRKSKREKIFIFIHILNQQKTTSMMVMVMTPKFIMNSRHIRQWKVWLSCHTLATGIFFLFIPNTIVIRAKWELCRRREKGTTRAITSTRVNKSKLNENFSVLNEVTKGGRKEGMRKVRRCLSETARSIAVIRE